MLKWYRNFKSGRQNGPPRSHSGDAPERAEQPHQKARQVLGRIAGSFRFRTEMPKLRVNVREKVSAKICRNHVSLNRLVQFDRLHFAHGCLSPVLEFKPAERGFDVHRPVRMRRLPLHHAVRTAEIELLRNEMI